MREIIDDLQDMEAFIFDLDGVVYRTHELIPNADAIINEIKDHSIKVVFNSNNSTITREMYVERLTNFGIDCEISDFYTSAYITAKEITKMKENATIYVIGEVGLREELKMLGHEVVKKPDRYEDVDFVIVGLDVHFRYSKLMIAQRCVLEGGAEFYATNDDATLPAADGLMPGAGVMVNALETCTGTPPEKVFGKPNPYGIELILRDHDLNPDKACIFGDRMETDILAGNRAGITTIAVLTGVTSGAMLEELRARSSEDGFETGLLPDLTLKSLEDVFKEM